ncbi:hypothetical protein BAUCODRAFT_143935 [Baudoinia panamericana UAMH 10762]|uniref:Uncharacterized protein n=1 Tax=Baudoinia panamericana (strain UAMH 10762) TaxID=717646 RepID=M2MI48_BAUPA|nr:uncharacterized protein BAUCODRAFT_143935 [Baudoinia panamericana UAMH 10762]EMC90938.1 hypothetical protein BAUCODRAFT_143935 [Baudoinia panamericana UAMH 10762]
MTRWDSTFHISISTRQSQAEAAVCAWLLSSDMSSPMVRRSSWQHRASADLRAVVKSVAGGSRATTRAGRLCPHHLEDCYFRHRRTLTFIRCLVRPPSHTQSDTQSVQAHVVIVSSSNQFSCSATEARLLIQLARQRPALERRRIPKTHFEDPTGSYVALSMQQMSACKTSLPKMPTE